MKKKPCEFCAEDVINYAQDEVEKLSINIEVYPDNNLIGFSVIGLTSDDREVEIMYDIPMNYCPNCGRRLC